MAQTNPIRFAVVGLGRVGCRHVHWIDHTPGLTLAGVCDPDAEARRRVYDDRADMPDVPAVDDYQTLIKLDADFIVIATPSHMHEAMTCQALEAGKHVFVEKPIASSAAQAQRMIAAAQKHQRILTINQCVRYQADTIAVRDTIASGQLGEITSLYRAQHVDKPRNDWQIWRAYGGGILANWGPHLVDTLLLMIDSPPVSLFAKMGRTLNRGDAEDWFKITMRAASGQMIETEILTATIGKAMWHVAGTKGTLYIEDNHPRPTMHVKTFDGHNSSQIIDLAIDGDTTGKHYADLAARLARGQQPAVQPEQVLLQMHILDAVRESDSTGQSVTIETGALAAN